MSMATIDTKKPANTNDTLVRKEIFVAAAQERAFDVFTKQMTVWWPLATHHIGKVDAVAAVVEPFAGGRWFERGSDGSECDWGRVLAWDPPKRLLLGWELTADWTHDASQHTEVEVVFTPENGGTRVTLEHRLLERFGARMGEVRAQIDAPGGWSGMLAAFAAAAAAQ